jgi:hypothetical protein
VLCYVLLGAGITHVLNVVGGRYPSDIPKDQFEIIPLSDYGTDRLETKLTHCFEFLRAEHLILCVCASCIVRMWRVRACDLRRSLVVHAGQSW